MNTVAPTFLSPLLARQWETAGDEAHDLDQYEHDWDGADADPVPIHLIRRTLALFRLLEEAGFPAPDMVYPAADGTVFVEWHFPGGVVSTINVTDEAVIQVTIGPGGEVLSGEPVRTGTLIPGEYTEGVDGDAFEFALAA